MSGSQLRAGDWLGRYELVDVLGRGGMGTVFLARDAELARDVAIKVINPEFAQDDVFRARFRREAVVLSQMDSPHVVSVHDHGEQDGAAYLVTQLVRGGDLFASLRDRGVLDPAAAIDIVGQVLAGLADAHAIGVVHRDVKPSNVLLRDGGEHAYLCDFGIATSPGGQLTRTGVVAGSSAYMAPERHAGDTDDDGVAADIYSVGCLLWTVLTGSQPFVGTDAEIAMGHLRGPIPQFPGGEPFQDRVNAVLRRALAKDPAKRYPSARAMRGELLAVKDVLPLGLVLPDVTSIRQPVEPPPERRRGRAVLVGTFVVLLVAAGVYAGTLLGGLTEVPALLTADAGTTTSGSDAGSPTSSSPEASRDAEQSGTAQEMDRSNAEGSVVPLEPGSLPGGPGGEVSTPRAGAGSAPARPRAAPKAAPAPQFRCWNGATSVKLGSCPLPTRKAGASWVFPGWTSAPGCKQRYLRASGYVEGWWCSRKTADGSYEVLLVGRWTTAAAGERFLWSQVAPGPSRTGGVWMGGNLRYGTYVQGVKDTKYRYGARVYTHDATNAWTFEAYANTLEKAANIFRYVQFRRPTDFRGVPLN